jgi:hypothetical protein
MPHELVPAGIRDYVVSTAAHLSVPVEAVAVSAVAAISGVIGRTYAMVPHGAGDTWRVIPNLWSLVIAPPGFKKSAILKSVSAPMQSIEDFSHNEYERRKEMSDREIALIDDEIQAIKKLKPVNIDKLKELRRRRESLQVSKAHFLLTHSTPARLAQLLSKNPRGLVLKADEAADVLSLLMKSGHETELSLYLGAWNGDESFTFEKMSGQEVRIKNACLAFLGTIQPGALEELLSISAFTNRGLLQRFQLMVKCESVAFSGEVERVVGKEQYEKIILLTNSIHKTTKMLDVAVTFDNEAQKIWKDWYKAFQDMLLGDDIASNESYHSHMSKFASLIPALALIFRTIAVATAASQPFLPIEVDADALVLAIAWAEYLNVHAKQIYGYKPKHEQISDAGIALMGKIRSGQVTDRMTFRTISRRCWKSLKDERDIEEATSELTRLGWLRVEADQAKRSRIVRVNPALSCST